jgi:hypothetical protein
MTRKPKLPEPCCPHCGCPELLSYGRQGRDGFAVVTSCSGCGKVVPREPASPVIEPGAASGMLAAEHGFIASIRSALAMFDSADQSRRHPDTCTCAFCEFVRSNRKLVADWDTEAKP